MTEDPETLRRNIRHYERMLNDHTKEYTHKTVRRLLTETKARLLVAITMLSGPSDGVEKVYEKRVSSDRRRKDRRL